MDAVSVDDIVTALQQALDDSERGLGGASLHDRPTTALREIARAADGDVRRG